MWQAYLSAIDLHVESAQKRLLITAAAVVVTGLQTCVALTMGQVFRPEDKWGPLSGMMKITHKVRSVWLFYKSEQHMSLQYNWAKTLFTQKGPSARTEDFITRRPGMQMRIAQHCLHTAVGAAAAAAGSAHIASGQELKTGYELQLELCSACMAASKSSHSYLSVQHT